MNDKYDTELQIIIIWNNATYELFLSLSNLQYY